MRKKVIFIIELILMLTVPIISNAETESIMEESLLLQGRMSMMIWLLRILRRIP